MRTKGARAVFGEYELRQSEVDAKEKARAGSAVLSSRRMNSRR
jgi:hypothetical protein